MEKELRELQELLRKGVSVWEYWKFLIHSEPHRHAFITHQQEQIPALRYWDQMIPFIEQLQTDDELVQEMVISQLLQMGNFAWEALFSSVSHESEMIRRFSFSILIQQEIPQTQQHALFVKFLTDPSAFVKLTALNALTLLEKIPFDLLPLILKLLEDTDFLVRQATVIALRNFLISYDS